MFNDLIEELERNGIKTYAYADDLAITGITDEMLGKTIDICQEWAAKNNMQINNSKSGIIFHNRKNVDQKIRNGYKVKDIPLV